MAVCFVSADAAGADESNDGALQLDDEGQESADSHYALSAFWEKVMEDMNKVTPDDFKQQALPLARIKRIMKLDDEVKMISAEAPLLFAKAAEIFIHELTLRAWIHTEENKRRTLQKNDISFAAAKSDQYDFLIDILPPDELKQTKSKEEAAARSAVSPDQVQYYLQLAQQHQAALQQPQATAQIQTQAAQPAVTSQIVQVQGATVQAQAQPAQAQPAQQLQLLQQIVTPNGEIQQIPIQLTQNQMNLLRMQMQGGSNQPILIQTGQPQLIQVNPQQQQAHPIYLTQVAALSDNEIIS